jgi:hypothetical protein
MIFTPDDVQNRLRERPFTPLRIVTTTGQAYDVFHADLVLVARRFLIVGIPSSENPGHADMVTGVALVHVAELRDLPSVVPPSGNGPPAA